MRLVSHSGRGLFKPESLNTNVFVFRLSTSLVYDQCIRIMGQRLVSKREGHASLQYFWGIFLLTYGSDSSEEMVQSFSAVLVIGAFPDKYLKRERNTKSGPKTVQNIKALVTTMLVWNQCTVQDLNEHIHNSSESLQTLRNMRAKMVTHAVNDIAQQHHTTTFTPKSSICIQNYKVM